MGEKGKVHEWCELCGWRVEMWERGDGKCDWGLIRDMSLPDDLRGGPYRLACATSVRFRFDMYHKQ
jgi:hypothetical protein